MRFVAAPRLMVLRRTAASPFGVEISPWTCSPGCSAPFSFLYTTASTRIVINGYLSNLSRPEQVVYFFRQVLDIPVVSKEVLSQRTNDYKTWVEAFARNHSIPIEWAEKGVCRRTGIHYRSIAVSALHSGGNSH
jgi:hypothetical protein